MAARHAIRIAVWTTIRGAVRVAIGIAIGIAASARVGGRILVDSAPERLQTSTRDNRREPGFRVADVSGSREYTWKSVAGRRYT